MSTFGSSRESGEGFENKLYQGIENFKPIFVNPTVEELKTIYGENAKEDEYISKNEDGNTQLKLVIYVDNVPEEGEPQIKTRLTYFIIDEERAQKEGNKKQYINVYGKTAWLEPDAKPAESGNYELVGAKGTYSFESEGARPALQGEEMLISFLRNILNLPSLKKADSPEEAKSQFSRDDWNKMFTGDVSILKSIILEGPNKIGLLLGVKTLEDGRQFQDVFNRQTLRQWAKSSNKFNYIRNEVENAQQNGAYPNTDFGNSDYILREYIVGNTTGNDAALSESSEVFGKFV